MPTISLCCFMTIVNSDKAINYVKNKSKQWTFTIPNLLAPFIKNYSSENLRLDHEQYDNQILVWGGNFWLRYCCNVSVSQNFLCIAKEAIFLWNVWNWFLLKFMAYILSLSLSSGIQEIFLEFNAWSASKYVLNWYDENWTNKHNICLLFRCNVWSKWYRRLYSLQYQISSIKFMTYL